MSGLLKLIDELLSVLDSELPCVVCTVAATRGSTPQKAGAMMLVFADGTQSGTLGGGCVEAEVKKQALAALTADTPVPKIHTFHLDEDYGWDDSLICGGRMTIVAEMASRAHFIYFASLKQLLDFGAAYTEVIALPENSSKAIPGTRGLFTVNGSFGGNLEFKSLALPLLIFLTQPLSLTCALAALWITGTPLNVSSYMGAILLVGLDVKNGILLIEYVGQLRRGGASLEDALPGTRSRNSRFTGARCR